MLKTLIDYMCSVRQKMQTTKTTGEIDPNYSIVVAEVVIIVNQQKTTAKQISKRKLQEISENTTKEKMK